MSLSMSVRGESLRAFFENPIFLSAISSWIFAQLIKTIIVLLRSHKKSVKEVLSTLLWRTGGMPSSHSSLVSSLAVSVGIREGIDSDLFIVTLFFAFIIIRDSLGVRRAAGLQGRALNILGRNAAERMGIEYHPVKEIHGHAPLEVVVGIMLGIFIAAAYAFL